MTILEQFKAFLKEKGLKDDVIDSIANDLKSKNIHLSNEENIDQRYQKLKGQKELLQSQLDSANTTLETLKKSNKGNEDLQAELQKLKDDNAALQSKYDADILLREKKDQVLSELRKVGALHPELLMASMDLEKIEMKDNKISGHKELIKKLQSDYADQFETQQDKDGGSGYKYNPPGGNNPQPNAADFIGAMSAFSVHK